MGGLLNALNAGKTSLEVNQKSIEIVGNKISNLNIESDDLFTAIGKMKSGAVFNLTMDYISKKLQSFQLKL